MADVERTPFNPPNEHIKDGSPDSCGPMGRSASPVMPPNEHIHSGDPGIGFLSLARHGSPVDPANEHLKFDVRNAKMPQPPSVVQPGKGSVPVNPFMPGGGTASSGPMPDSPVRRAK